MKNALDNCLLIQKWKNRLARKFTTVHHNNISRETGNLDTEEVSREVLYVQNTYAEPDANERGNSDELMIMTRR